jgi:hypothetical protein
MLNVRFRQKPPHYKGFTLPSVSLRQRRNGPSARAEANCSGCGVRQISGDRVRAMGAMAVRSKLGEYAHPRVPKILTEGQLLSD